MNNTKEINSNYRWAVLAMGTFAVLGALGLPRFGYTMILPSMQSSLGLDNSQAGLLATADLIGYLCFALIGGALAARFGIRLVTALGLLFAGVGMILTGLADTFLPVVFSRVITGMGSGTANVAVMGLWGAWFARKKGFAAGIAVTGSSIGLVFTGLFVPWILADYGEIAWRTSWLIFGGITILLALGAYAIVRNSPTEIKTHTEVIAIRQEKDKQRVVAQGRNLLWQKVFLAAPVWCLGLVYIAFGFSYIIFTTFFTKFLISSHGYTTVEAGKTFMLMGWFSFLSGVFWGSVSDLIGRKNTLVVLFLTHALAFGLFGIGKSPVVFTLSAVLFGLAAWSIPAIMATTCNDLLGSKLAPAAFGFITLFFGIGQALGPVVGGAIADLTGSFSSAFLLASVAALFGATGSAFLVKETRTADDTVVHDNGQKSRV